MSGDGQQGGGSARKLCISLSRVSCRSRCYLVFIALQTAGKLSLWGTIVWRVTGGYSQAGATYSDQQFVNITFCQLLDGWSDQIQEQTNAGSKTKTKWMHYLSTHCVVFFWDCQCRSCGSSIRAAQTANWVDINLTGGACWIDALCILTAVLGPLPAGCRGCHKLLQCAVCSVQCAVCSPVQLTAVLHSALVPVLTVHSLPAITTNRNPRSPSLSSLLCSAGWTAHHTPARPIRAQQVGWPANQEAARPSGVRAEWPVLTELDSLVEQAGVPGSRACSPGHSMYHCPTPAWPNTLSRKISHTLSHSLSHTLSHTLSTTLSITLSILLSITLFITLSITLSHTLSHILSHTLSHTLT